MTKLSVPESFPAHRFIEWFEGEGFAFARGLAVAPIHLPLVLDAARADGYELITCFGKPRSTEMGFLFRKVNL